MLIMHILLCGLLYHVYENKLILAYPLLSCFHNSNQTYESTWHSWSLEQHLKSSSASLSYIICYMGIYAIFSHLDYFLIYLCLICGLLVIRLDLNINFLPCWDLNKAWESARMVGSD